MPGLYRGTRRALLGGGGGYGPEQTLTLQPDGTAGLDTYIASNDSTDFSASDDILTGVTTTSATQRTLIKFDLSSIPAGSLVSSAVLTLYLRFISVGLDERTVNVHRLKRAWVLAEAKWGVYSLGNAWQTAGGFGANDCEQTALGSTTFAAGVGVGFKDFTLTAATKEALDLGNGWLMKLSDETAIATDSVYRYRSSNFSTADQRPKLVVVYRSPL